MKQTILLITAITFLNACSSPKNVATGNTDKTYGYTEKNAIKVGGQSNGPMNERNYLNSLVGPNGEKVFFDREGSCCAFETKNSSFGGGMLDRYSVTYEGKKDTVVLFINMYDKATLKAPVGFKFRN